MNGEAEGLDFLDESNGIISVRKPDCGVICTLNSLDVLRVTIKELYDGEDVFIQLSTSSRLLIIK